MFRKQGNASPSGPGVGVGRTIGEDLDFVFGGSKGGADAVSFRFLDFSLKSPVLLKMERMVMCGVGAIRVIFVPGTGFPDTEVEPEGEGDEVSSGWEQEEGCGI